MPQTNNKTTNTAGQSAQLFSKIVDDYKNSHIGSCDNEKSKEELLSSIEFLKAKLGQLYKSYEDITLQDIQSSDFNIDRIPPPADKLFLKITEFISNNSFSPQTAHEEYAKGLIEFKVYKNVPEGIDELQLGHYTFEDFRLPKGNAEIDCDSKIPILTTSSDPSVLQHLVTLKNIFTTQLPRMPKEYVIRVLFDPHHSIFAMWKNKKLIGGIAYRPFISRDFAEIVFCAISHTEQVKGNGSLMMDLFKEHIKQQKINALLTYADNFAIGFFKKQGFTAQSNVPKEQWLGYIKNYDGSSLMECILYENVNYTNIKKETSAQIESFDQNLKNKKFYKTTINQIKKQIQNNLKTKLQSDIEQTEEQKREEFIQIIKNCIEGYSDHFVVPEQIDISLDNKNTILFKDEDTKRVSAKLAALLTRIGNSKNAWAFLKPVDTTQVTDYEQYVTNPMDIGTLGKKFSEGAYQNLESFRKDVQLIFENCRAYNSVTSNFVRCANMLEKEVEIWCAELFDKNIDSR